MDRVNEKHFVASGYEVRPAVNGGFMLLAGTWAGDKLQLREMAAFSNHKDLLEWLSEGHSQYATEMAG